MAAHHDIFTDNLERLREHPNVRRTVAVRSTSQATADRTKWATKHKLPAIEDFSFLTPTLTEPEAMAESDRCMKCADAPCVKGCPTGVDVKQFNYSISKESYYHAAKVIYSDNPLGLTCGVLCSTSHLCAGCCNMNTQIGGAIEIGKLQQFACDVFQKMRIPQTRDPALPPVDKMPESYKAKIAIIGAGPAGLSCATYLARLGYTNITIFEKLQHAGGLSYISIPEYRIPLPITDAEVRMVEELGVKIEYGKQLGTDFTLESLKSQGYETIFVGIGVHKPFTLPFLQGTNIHTSADFLANVAVSLRDKKGSLPKLSGHVLVLGGGDVAFDSAGTALRCGATNVTMAFREDFASQTCSAEEYDFGKSERIEMISNAVPVNVVREGDRVTGVIMEARDWNQKKAMYAPGQTFTVKCDHVIVAFGGSAVTSVLSPLEFTPNGRIKINPDTNETSVSNIFAGGDCGTAANIVTAVNDGKTAAWFMHKRIQENHKLQVAAIPALPMMHTAVDDVDISVDFCGLHFINPFGLSSATPTGSIAQIRRAFEMGWGFAVTKTALSIPATNISPRIIRAPSYRKRGQNQIGFQNIELLTEKTVSYWVEGVKQLKKEFPKHIVIFSVMASAEKEEWEKIAMSAVSSGADALELNLSCPHVGKKGFGMLAGQTPEMVKEITSWVRKVVPAHIPVFTKLTPNVTDIAQIALAAKEGGATGVSAINTISGLTNVQSNAIPYPNVGAAQKTAYGGVSGNIIRPMALKAVSSIRRNIPDLPILGIGGIDSAESALQMIHCGAGVIQFTSAIQNQEYTIIDELCYGLKALLYMKGRPDLATWMGQLPPLGFQPSTTAPVAKPVTIANQIGLAVPRISVVPELDLDAQVKASVDVDRCIHCGKCYMTCNDTGYVAIKFDAETHIPTITDDCMGCGLCQSVCPASCIEYKLKTAPHTPCRGIPEPGLVLPFDPSS